VKIFLAIALVLTAALAGLSLWGVGHARSVAVSSSQIFIHGTPVCVSQRGGEIQASVGECTVLFGGPREEREEAEGFHNGDPHVGLPPGHPPIGPGTVPLFEENRRTLI